MPGRKLHVPICLDLYILWSLLLFYFPSFVSPLLLPRFCSTCYRLERINFSLPETSRRVVANLIPSQSRFFFFIHISFIEHLIWSFEPDSRIIRYSDYSFIIAIVCSSWLWFLDVDVCQQLAMSNVFTYHPFSTLTLTCLVRVSREVWLVILLLCINSEGPQDNVNKVPLDWRVCCSPSEQLRPIWRRVFNKYPLCQLF